MKNSNNQFEIINYVNYRYSLRKHKIFFIFYNLDTKKNKYFEYYFCFKYNYFFKCSLIIIDDSKDTKYSNICFENEL